ncbi:ATP-binding protein [Nostoc sp. FACHB-190]|uniref:ATP-binding protein n=1 Tax=Nostoc sp. FACHB-190 TaxID=2692838 RepID=UPI001683F3FD|nr:ATP-binding protein [Nostoc sp. FACHB-190]MBD2298961.1 ATP-binding protein [Nostoc sp. FACHB-190]
MKDVKLSELNQRVYSLSPRLNLMLTVSVLGAVFCTLAGHVGDGIAKKELCFYPKSARIHDAPIQAGEGDPEKILLGKKYCRYEQRSQIPEPYLKANQYRTSNPNYNPWAFLQHENLYVFRELPSDNPFKNHFGLGAMVLGGIGLLFTGKARDYLSDIRPHYRATKEFESVRANYSLKFGEQLLEMSGNELVKYLRGIKIAEARQQFIASITPQQQTALLMAMSADDYYEFGHLLDGGASFEKFEPVQAQLPHGDPGTVQEQIEQPAIAPTNDETITEVLRRVAREDGSTALCGDPGTGKSTITREYIRQVEANCPNADMRVLAVKNDSFNGLRERGKVTRFVGENAIDNARTFFLGVQTEYNKRLELTEDGRESLPPFVIILDDWLTIAAKLNKVKPEDLGFDFGQILFDVLIVGREYNMKFFVNLHSLNLKAIGIQELDQNTRKVLRLLLLGNRYRKDGREIDAYGVIEQAIMGNQVITHAKDKEAVRTQYSELKAQSRSQYQPVMFAFVGGYYLGLVPKFQQAEVNDRPVTAEDKSRLEALYHQMEFDIKPQPQNPTPKLSPQAQALHGYLQRTNRTKAVIQEIQPNFKVKGDRFSSDELKSLFYELVENSLAAWIDAQSIQIRTDLDRRTE